MRSALAWLAAGVLTCRPAPAPAQTASTEPLTLEAAIDRATTAHPSVAAAQLRRAAASSAVNVARERLNPEARVEMEREAPNRVYSLALPIETGGKRDRRIAVSEAAVRVSDAELARTRQDVRSAVRRAYFGRLVAEARLGLLQELRDLSVRARDAAQQRFDAGSAPRLEVLQAELARADVENQATASEGDVTATRLLLNTWLVQPPDAAIALSTPLDPGAPVTAAAAIELARSRSADIAVLDRLLVEQRARVSLAAAQRMPDVTPEGTITRSAQPDFSTGWRLGIAMAVPLFTQHRAGILLEEAVLAQLTAEREAALARLTGEVSAAAAVAESRRQQFVRYRDQIVPQAVEVERLAEDSYRLGQTGIAALLQALQATRDVRLRAVQSAFDYHAALADLERAIGAPLP